MCEQDCENKKLVITKFSTFLQTQNSNFRLSANRALSFTLLLIPPAFAVIYRANTTSDSFVLIIVSRSALISCVNTIHKTCHRVVKICNRAAKYTGHPTGVPNSRFDSLLRSRFLGCHATLPPKKRLLTTEQHSFHEISQSQSRFHFQEPVRAKFVR